MNITREMKEMRAATESPCMGCPNRSGAKCTFYNADIGEDPIPCEQCEDDCGDAE